LSATLREIKAANNGAALDEIFIKHVGRRAAPAEH